MVGAVFEVLEQACCSTCGLLIHIVLLDNFSSAQQAVAVSLRTVGYDMPHDFDAVSVTDVKMALDGLQSHLQGLLIKTFTVLVLRHL